MPDDPGAADSTAALFNTMFTIIVIGLIAAVVVSVFVAVIRARRFIQAGRNPLTVDADLALKVLDSDLLKPEQPAPSFASRPISPAKSALETRLDELDDLLAKGKISREEHASARAAALGL